MGKKEGEGVPTERFYRLPEEKREIIRNAAMEEFIRMPYEKASINQIIQRAGISRGSFYTYFEDKRDVLEYLISDLTRQVRENWEFCLKKNAGDLWKSAGEILDNSVRLVQEDKMFQMMQNIVVCQDFGKIFSQIQETFNFGDRLMAVVGPLLDVSKFRKQDFRYLKQVMTMVQMNMMDCAGEYYLHPENLENIKKDFQERLEILQYGVCK